MWQWMAVFEFSNAQVLKCWKSKKHNVYLNYSHSSVVIQLSNDMFKFKKKFSNGIFKFKHSLYIS